MGANKQEFTEERENFFTRLEEGEQYAIISCDMGLLGQIQNEQIADFNYTLHGIKQRNSKHREDDLLCSLYKESKKIKKKILEREQNINHNNKT